MFGKKITLIVAILVSAFVTAEAQTRTAMYRYQNSAGAQSLAAGENRKNFIGKPQWKQVGLVGYVYMEKTPASTTLLEVMQPSANGANRYFYSTDTDEANSFLQSDGNWKMGSYDKGRSCFVAAKKLPGTIPVYLYKEPTGADDYIYIVGDKENNAFQKIAAPKGIVFKKIAFYIWSSIADSSAGNDETNAAQNKTAPKKTMPGSNIGEDDFSLRDALYMNGAADASTLDTTAPYVSNNQKITLSRADAVSCTGDTCVFNFGLIVNRRKIVKSGSLELSVTGKNLTASRARADFKVGASTARVVFPYRLKTGENVVYVTLDPTGAIAETDENNNRFRAIIVVTP